MRRCQKIGPPQKNSLDPLLIVAQVGPGLLGMYYHDLSRNCWVQVNTETNDENFRSHYVYRDDDGVWWIRDDLGEKDGYFKNETKSEEIPTTGWKVNCGSEGWEEDPTLTIRHGPLIPLCDALTITVNEPKLQEWSKYVGVYKHSSKWWLGHPVYTNSNGKFLYNSCFGGWSVGGKLELFQTDYNYCLNICRWKDLITVTTGETHQQ